jgi:hypothetical protein
MANFGVFKRHENRSGSTLFVSWAATLEDSKKQIEDLLRSDGHFIYFVIEFILRAEVWSWSPAAAAVVS